MAHTIFSRAISPVGVFAPILGKRTCPPFCVKGGKVVFTPSKLTNPQVQQFKPRSTPITVSTGGAVIKGRPQKIKPRPLGLPKQFRRQTLVSPPSSRPAGIIPPGKILPRPQRINVAGNTISEIPAGQNANFPNRLKNIELGSTATAQFNVAIIAVIAVGLLFFLTK